MRIDLTLRQIDILKQIISSYSPIDIQFFVSKYQKSERTIRYDIDRIKQELSKYNLVIKNKPKQGFYIPTTQKAQCLQLLDEIEINGGKEVFIDSTEVRYHSLLLYFITKNKEVSADEIAKRFYISKSTLLRNFKNFDAFFNYDIQLVSQKSQGFRIVGDEYVIRKKCSELISKSLRESYNAKDWYMLLPSDFKDSISFNDLESITQSIKRVNSQYNVWITNHSFVHLVSYFIISLVRKRKCTFSAKDAVVISQIKEKNATNYAVDLIHEVEKENGSVFKEEVDWLLKIMTENNIFISSSSAKDIPIDEVLSDIIRYLQKEEIKYRFDTVTLYQDLKEHLYRFIHLDDLSNQHEDNQIVKEITTRYKDYYELAKQCSKIFTNYTQLHMSKIEVCYIAIYLYKNLIRKSDKYKRILVVCATGKGVSHLLTTRIKNIFKEIEVVAQVSPYQMENLHQWDDIDFVVSTIPIDNCVYPVVKVSRLLTGSDIQRIQGMIYYGEFVDSIPFNQENVASITKQELTSLLDSAKSLSNQEFELASGVISKLILNLIESVSNFPIEYRMSDDTLLGLVIHVVIAIPRWCSYQKETDENLHNQYYNVVSNHPEVFSVMEKYFEIVEKTLMLELTISERYAFYLYILEGINVNEKNSN